MGTANAALTTADLYFTWCMAKGVRVHLGYWLAQACHQMAANPSRHMYTCHLLGAYLQRNVILKIAKSCRDVEMCLPPEVFNVDYFFNKGLLYMSGKEVCFYEVGGSEVQVKQETASVEAGAKIEVEEVRKEVGWMRSEIKMVREEIVALRGKGKDSVDVEKVRKEVAGVRTEVAEMRMEVGKVREEIVALKGRITDLVAASSRHTDRMAEGVSLMMIMTKWLKAKFPEAPISLPGPGSVSKSPGQGSLSLQKPPQATRPLTAPSATKPLTVRKTVPGQSEEMTETPDSPAKKKAKVTQPSAPLKAGSRGGQTPN